MSDGLTAEQERRKGHECSAWCVFQSWVSDIRGGAVNTDDLGIKNAYDAIASEARAPIEARAEAAEARVAELERAVIWMSGSAEFGPGQPAHDRWVEIRDTLLFAPTTEAVTE